MDVTNEILDIIPVAYFHLDKKKIVTYINQSASIFLKKEKEDCIGRNIKEILPSTDALCCLSTLDKCQLNGKLAAFDYLSTLSDRWIRLTAIPVNNGTMISFTDIDDLMQAEKSKDQYRVFIETNFSKAYRMNADWTKMYDLNGENIFAESQHSQGTWIDIFIPQKAIKKLSGAIEIAIKNKQTFEFEHQIIKADGTLVWVYSKAIPLLDTINGEILEWLGTWTDIDTLKQVEISSLEHDQHISQQQHIFRVALNTLEEERRSVSESLHNGLGQLLYGIKLSMNYLTQKIAIETPEKYLDSKRYSESLLTEAIRQTRRISHELMPTVLAEFGLSAAIKEVCDQLQEIVSFSCWVSVQAVKFDKYLELAVFRTVHELMINVEKYAKAQHAFVRVVADEDNIIIQVSDDGIGISSERLDKTGVGLYSIENKVHLLKGFISIIPQLSGGTIVKVIFPVY